MKHKEKNRIKSKSKKKSKSEEKSEGSKEKSKRNIRRRKMEEIEMRGKEMETMESGMRKRDLEVRKKEDNEEKAKKTQALVFFTKKILEKYKKEINAIWAIRHAKEFLIIILINNLKFRKEKIEKIKEYSIKIIKEEEKKLNIPMHIDIFLLDNYYKSIIENRIEIFAEIKNAILLYDAGGYFIPIKKLIEEGEIKGTKEAFYRLITLVRKNMKEVENKKVSVLSDIYSAVIDASEAALMAVGIVFFVPKEISPLLEKHFLKKKLISKKTFETFTEIYNLYKAYEHEEIATIEGKKLDELRARADFFIDEMQELASRAFEKDLKEREMKER